MQPEEQKHQEDPKPLQPHQLADPTKSSKTLAIALVVAGIFFVIAIGIVVWLLATRPQTASTTNNVATDDVKNVKNVTLVPPTDLPANYVKSDQSKADATQLYYYDDATNCGFTVGVAPVPGDKSVKDFVVDTITASQAQGITTTARTEGDTYKLTDADDNVKLYVFDSINLDQDVKVDGIAFTKQHTAILYKQFGQKVASLSYACKAETWTDKKVELATLVSKFTVKTER